MTHSSGEGGTSVWRQRPIRLASNQLYSFFYKTSRCPMLKRNHRPHLRCLKLEERAASSKDHRQQLSTINQVSKALAEPFGTSVR